MANDLGRLNDILFAELERLEGAGKDDIEVEAERAKHIRNLSATVIDNAKTVMEAYRIRQGSIDETAGQIAVPRMLQAGDDR